MSLVSRFLPGLLGLCLGLTQVHALGLPNPSFEFDRFTVWPGFTSSNGSISGWTSSGQVGLNPSPGNPYANNGATPDGVNVAFIQSSVAAPGILSTTLSGLTKGQSYSLRFRANMRSGTGAPVASYSINGGAAVSFNVSPAVGGQNGYYPISARFIATGPKASLLLKNAAAGDTTLLVDDFRLAALTEVSGEESPAPFFTQNPAAAATWMIATQGIYPSDGLDANDPFLGEVRLFAGGAETAGEHGWLPCDGRALPINQNQALYSLLGVTYGGNNQTTFHVPDLRGRTPIGDGQGPGLINRVVGETGGGSTVLTEANLPPHAHGLTEGNTMTAGTGTPAANMPPYMVLRPWISTSATMPLLNGAVRWYAGYQRFPGQRCDGSALDTGSHGTLFSRIGYTFGGSDATFHVPDLRGRMAIGCGEGNGLTPRVTGEKGGSDTWALTLADLPAHTHDYYSNDTASSAGGGVAASAAMPAYLVLTPTVAMIGGGSSSNSFPAYGELRFFAVTPERILEDQGEEPAMWALCQGGMISAGENFGYYDAVGNLWGGDANQGTAGLPDLRGRALACAGQAGSFPNRAPGAYFGTESVSLTAGHLPQHDHGIDFSTTTLLTRRYAAEPEGMASFAATVRGTDGMPTGEVSFYLGNTLLGTAALDAEGIATLTAGPFAGGTHVVRANYTGDADSCPSVSPPVLVHDAGWSVLPWTGDGDSGISYGTQWAYRFGSNNTASIGGINLTGIGGANPESAGKFAVSGMNLIHVSDTNELTALGGSGSAEIARTFVYNGNPGTITLQDLTPGKQYLATILSTGFDATVGSRKVTFSSGGASYEVDQGHYGNNRGIRLDYAFTADAGTRDITLSPANAGQSWHLCALALRELSQGFAVFNGNSTAPADQREHNTGSVNFPDTLTGGSSTAKSFTVQNTGGTHLPVLLLTKSGDYPDDFVLASESGTDLAPGETKHFTVVFSPTDDGARSATLNIEAWGGTFAIPVSGNAPSMTVTSLTDAALRSAIQTANAAAGPMSIRFDVPGGGVVALGSELPKLTNPNGILIDGSNGGQGAITIDGGSTGPTNGNRIFFVGVSPDLAGLTPTPQTLFRMTNLTLRNGNARGGSGGGGGAGMGGAIFLNAGELELSNVQFSNNRAIGGNGGSGSGSESGGDGGIGTGGSCGTAGINGAQGEDVHPDGIAGGPGGAGEGGAGANGSGGGRGGNGGDGGDGGMYYGPGGDGGAGGNGGSGGSAAFGGGGADGGSGGNGGEGGRALQAGGINWAAGTGGKGGNGLPAGNGGFGGGGGGGGRGGNGGESGLGLGPGGTGGNGGTSGASGIGGFGAGNGAPGGPATAGSVSPSYNIRGAGGAGGYGGAGGGGAGLGGAVFVRKGATLTVKDGVISGGTASGGSGGTNGITTAGNGQGLGSALFLAGSLSYEVSGGSEVTIADSFGGGSDVQISGGFIKKGTGSLVLAGSNNYIGGTILEAGTLGLGHDSALGSSPLTINGGGLRAVGGARFPQNAITANASFTLGGATHLMGSLALNADITITSTNPTTGYENSGSTLAGVISGTHSITFAEGVHPTGTLFLGGANTYTGNTILAGGRVGITGSQNVLPDETTLIFAGHGARLELSKPQETVKAVYVGTTQLAAGTWGATGSGATHLNDTLFAGSGLLTVTTGPTFESWLAEKGLTGDDAAFDADPNGNGIVNGLEFVLGGEPALPGQTPRPTLLVDGNEVVFTFQRMDLSAPFNPVVEWNTGLSGDWAIARQGVNATIETSNGAPADIVRVRIPKNGLEKIFVRLRATGP